MDIKNLVAKSLDELLATLNILKITTNVKDFEAWLKNYHDIELTDNIFEGYKFFVTTIIRVLDGAIESDTSLELNEDVVFFRARFKGIPIEEIPNTCEKTVFIKNLLSLTKPLRKSKSWKEIKNAIRNLNRLFELFDNLYKESKPTINIEKSTALNILSKFYTLILLNDTQRGLPLGYYSASTLKANIGSKYLEKVFEGYVLTLQYLWFKLLSAEIFNNSCVNSLHEVLKTNNVEGWYALVEFYGKINGEIIEPLEDELKMTLGIEPLLVIEKVDKNIFRHLLSKRGLDEPEYFKKRRKDDIKKWLDYKLLWYNVEVLSSTGSIFSGVPAFIAILLGLTKLVKDKIFVKVFEHEVEGVNGYDYSYGILIPAFGSLGITDYSGWLIFFDCATDYSGFGGSLYSWAKFWIDKLKKDNLIEVEEIEVDKNIFKEYLKERSVSSVFDMVVADRIIDISKIKSEFEELKGYIFELIVYKWLTTKNFDKIRHNHFIDGEQIDVFYREGKKIYLYECKVALHKDSLKDKLKQIKRKTDVLRRKYPEYTIVPILVVYFPLSSEVKKIF